MLLSLKRNRLFLNYLLIFIALEILSFLAFNFNILNLFILLILILLVFILGYRKPTFLFLIPLMELFWGSLGHSFIYGIFNTRLIIFLAVLFIFLIKYFQKLNKLKILENKKLLFIYLLFFLFIILGIVRGYLNNNFINNIFLDANAYLYLLYLPIWYEVYNSKYLKDILTILIAATTIIALKTLILFNIFRQDYSFLNLELIYKWLRDTRTGEITSTIGSYRIFIPAQIYIIFSWFFIFIQQIKKFNYYNLFYLIILTTALIISLSRSFYLGFIFAFLILILNIYNYKKELINFKFFFNFILIFFSSFFLMQIIANIPKINNIIDISGRVKIEAAANSRLALLPQMIDNIKEAPLLGQGFGKEISYQSSDPKNEGTYTTFSFEWGYLDQIVKGGLGLVWILIIWLYRIYYVSSKKIKDKPLLFLTLNPFLIALIIIHIFSPYLNHPLGLGFLILSTILINHE